MIAGKVLRIVCNLLKYGNKNSSGGVVWMFRGRQRFAEMKRSVQLLLVITTEKFRLWEFAYTAIKKKS